MFTADRDHTTNQLSTYISAVLREYPAEIRVIWNADLADPVVDIPPIAVIHLRSNVTRYTYITYVMQKLKLNYTLFIFEEIAEEVYETIKFIREHCGIQPVMNRGEMGCCLSHLFCIQHIFSLSATSATTAASAATDRVVVLEDDVLFSKDFVNKFTQTLANPAHNAADMIMLGAIDKSLGRNLPTTAVVTAANEQGYYRAVGQPSGGFGNVYKREYALRFIEQKMGRFTGLDYNYFKYKTAAGKPPIIHIVFPNIVTSEFSTSNLQHGDICGNIPGGKKEKDYYAKFFWNFNYSDYYFMYIAWIAQFPQLTAEEWNTMCEQYPQLCFDFFADMQGARTHTQAEHVSHGLSSSVKDKSVSVLVDAVDAVDADDEAAEAEVAGVTVNLAARATALVRK